MNPAPQKLRLSVPPSIPTEVELDFGGKPIVIPLYTVLEAVAAYDRQEMTWQQFGDALGLFGAQEYQVMTVIGQLAEIMPQLEETTKKVLAAIERLGSSQQPAGPTSVSESSVKPNRYDSANRSST